MPAQQVNVLKVSRIYKRSKTPHIPAIDSVIVLVSCLEDHVEVTVEHPWAIMFSSKMKEFMQELDFVIIVLRPVDHRYPPLLRRANPGELGRQRMSALNNMLRLPGGPEPAQQDASRNTHRRHKVVIKQVTKHFRRPCRRYSGQLSLLQAYKRCAVLRKEFAQHVAASPGV